LLEGNEEEISFLNKVKIVCGTKRLGEQLMKVALVSLKRSCYAGLGKYFKDLALDQMRNGFCNFLDMNLRGGNGNIPYNMRLSLQG
jgi:hypothetical protein